MAKVKAFCCVRPNAEVVSKVAALPYDVYGRKEAKKAVEGNPLSFLNIDRPETQFGEDFDMYSDEAYEKARTMLQAEIADGTFVKDEAPAFYVMIILRMSSGSMRIHGKRRNRTGSVTWTCAAPRPGRSSWLTAVNRR